MQTITVSSVRELSSPPDVCDLRILVRTSKPSASEATESAKKRIDYILQVIRDQKIGRKQVQLGRSLGKLKDEYVLCSELSVTITGDIERWLNIHNIIVEKLDHVLIAEPVFYHSDGCLQQLRQNAFTQAIKHCKEKAEGIAGTLRTEIGGVVSVEEKESREWRGSTKVRASEGKLPGDEEGFSICRGVESAFWNVSTRVVVVFQLEAK